MDVPARNIERLKKGGHKVGWNYVDGCMILAMLETYRITGEKRYLEFADAFIDHRKAIELIYSQVQTQPRTTEGNFWHKKIYPHQVWLDGSYEYYMSEPIVADDAKGVGPFLLAYT